MTDGSVIVSGDNVALYASVGGGIELSNVVVEGVRLAGSDSSGTIEAKDGSTLTGDILHSGFAEGTLELILSDSVWNGSVEASGDIGVINVDLGNSQWNVTGDSNTNGKITGDADSKIDFNGTTDTITVIIDNLTGEPAISMKPDDKLIIKNADGKFESSNPDVIEVIETENGVEIISKGDGEAELKYSYIDEDGKIKEATIKVVSGAGSQTSGETSRGGGSSNCNTGVGAALFALFGLAFIQKRK
ncbi:hypothetical protein LJC40_07815 [Synergistaceae bacterium OttesenSCG-928-D05]|nr:hypothetical protein [Synergistaceae bacterium OttesenSCG-928-D05]